VSLIPKTRLKAYYMKTYGMLDGGIQLYLEDLELVKLMQRYDV